MAYYSELFINCDGSGRDIQSSGIPISSTIDSTVTVGADTDVIYLSALVSILKISVTLFCATFHTVLYTINKNGETARITDVGNLLFSLCS